MAMTSLNRDKFVTFIMNIIEIFKVSNVFCIKRPKGSPKPIVCFLFSLSLIISSFVTFVDIIRQDD